jgi:hypothetical protein
MNFIPSSCHPHTSTPDEIHVLARGCGDIFLLCTLRRCRILEFPDPEISSKSLLRTALVRSYNDFRDTAAKGNIFCREKEQRVDELVSISLFHVSSRSFIPHHSLKMRSAISGSLALTGVAAASSLGSLCTDSYAKSILPSGTFGPDINVDTSSVTTSVAYNYSLASSDFYPAATFDYCNITFAYSHTGRDDTVHVSYWLPAPEKFANRYLATGGGGYAINSGSSTVAGGVAQGAVSGITDGRFGNFDTQLDAVFQSANGTANWDAIYMFAYQAIWEATLLGKHIASEFFNSSGKIYTYYQGCSEGGRDGWSQVQRFAEEIDGAVVS